MHEIASSAKGRRPGLRFVLLSGAVLIAAVFSGGCGDKVATDSNILTIVRVEERLADGSWGAVSGASVNYQIYASRATDTVHIPIYQEYMDTTDDWGLSAVRRDPNGKTPGEIGLVFVEVTHPDGRTFFRRWRIERDFDFGQWSLGFMPEDGGVDALVARVCATVESFPNCRKTLESSGFVTWGRGALARFPGAA